MAILNKMEAIPIKIIDCKVGTCIEVQEYLFSKGYKWKQDNLMWEDDMPPDELTRAKPFYNEVAIVLLSNRTIAWLSFYEFYNLTSGYLNYQHKNSILSVQRIDSDKFLEFTKRKEKLEKLNEF